MQKTREEAVWWNMARVCRTRTMTHAYTRHGIPKCIHKEWELKKHAESCMLTNVTPCMGRTDPIHLAHLLPSSLSSSPSSLPHFPSSLCPFPSALSFLPFSLSLLTFSLSFLPFLFPFSLSFLPSSFLSSFLPYFSLISLLPFPPFLISLSSSLPYYPPSCLHPNLPSSPPPFLSTSVSSFLPSFLPSSLPPGKLKRCLRPISGCTVQFKKRILVQLFFLRLILTSTFWQGWTLWSW